MSAFKRIMIGLDLSDMDQVLIRYTAFLCQRLQPEVVYFITVQSDLDVPDEVRAEFPEMQVPLDEHLRARMQEEIEKWFPASAGMEVHIEVVEGSPRREILRWTHIKDVDLLILGRKDEVRGSGIIPVQLARKISCSLLFVPERPPHTLARVMVGSDFSDCSYAALDQALACVDGEPEAQVWVFHSFSVPMGYYKTGKTEAQFAEIMKGHAARHYDDFIAPVKTPSAVTLAPILAFNVQQVSPAILLYERAQREGAELMVVGARGRNAVTALLLGSVAERLIKLGGQIPLLLAKRKHATFSFLDMIESI
ncbi:MAG: universal stress protein [Bacteroidetes bacterium]|nr:MAG: universal stress protein [Bacteroidota bacterium]